jgi:hypothetical protein
MDGDWLVGLMCHVPSNLHPKCKFKYCTGSDNDAYADWARLALPDHHGLPAYTKVPALASAEPRTMEQCMTRASIAL